MTKKTEVKTKKERTPVSKYISQIKNEKVRKDCMTLLNVFKKATGKSAKIWGTRFVGFGEFKYRRASGDEIKYFATGFRPGKTDVVIYVLSGLSYSEALLKKLGPYKKTGSCLYLKSLEQIDLLVLEKIIRVGVKNLKFKFAIV